MQIVEYMQQYLSMKVVHLRSIVLMSFNMAFREHKVHYRISMYMEIKKSSTFNLIYLKIKLILVSFCTLHFTPMMGCSGRPQTITYSRNLLKSWGFSMWKGSKN